MLGGTVYSQAKLLYNLLLKVINCFGQPQAYTPQDTRTRASTHASVSVWSSGNTERLFKHECVSLPAQIPLCIHAHTNAHTHAQTTCCTFCMQKFKCVCVCVWDRADSISFFFLPSCCLSLDVFFVAAYPRMHLSFLMLYKSLKFVKVVCILILLVFCILNRNVR